MPVGLVHGISSLAGALGALAEGAARGKGEPEPAPLSVVVVGGTRGLGKALAREFLWQGDTVFITGRSSTSVAEAVASLRRQTSCQPQQLSAAVCDCSSPRAMAGLAEHLSTMEAVDIFIANAGISGGLKAFDDADACMLNEVVSTTIGGTVLSAHAALRVFAAQRRRGATKGSLWLTDGAGANGDATPMYSAYGCCKAAVRQFARSLQSESPPSAVVGLLSPGLVLTDLLLDGNHSPRTKAAFNVLAQLPETCAAQLVPRIRAAHVQAVRHHASRGPHLRVLTPATAALQLMAFPWTRRRYFDALGRPRFAAEEDRIAALQRGSRPTGRSLTKVPMVTSGPHAKVAGVAIAAALLATAVSVGPW